MCIETAPENFVEEANRGRQFSRAGLIYQRSSKITDACRAKGFRASRKMREIAAIAAAILAEHCRAQ
jgi:hypothetical protein